jgi:alpha-tubulin suppressor-like RCC1 family protein
VRRSGRLNPRSIVPIVTAAGLAIAAAGCGREASSPTGPVVEGEAATTAAQPLTFLQVSAGWDHACGVAIDGRAWCWGNGSTGQLGTGDLGPDTCTDRFPCSRRPVAVVGGLRFRHVSAGAGFTCGVTTGDRIYCWGINDLGQLGAPTPGHVSATPVPVFGNRRYRQVRSGGNSSCAIAMSRAAFCWGGNTSGQLGNGTATASRTPVKLSGARSWVQLTMGDEHACGITTDQRAWCWGTNSLGELGDGTLAGRRVPAAVNGSERFDQIEAGLFHTCAVSTAGTGYCWGSGVALGNGSNNSQLIAPNPVIGNRKYQNVSSGINRSCGVSVAGIGFCWGSNGGTLGDGGTANAIVPTRLSGDVRFLAISAGGASFSCGVDGEAHAWCWGSNLFGTLGDGTEERRGVPTRVVAP